MRTCWHSIEFSSLEYVKIDKDDWGDGSFGVEQGYAVDDDGVGGKRARETLSKHKELLESINNQLNNTK